MKLLPYLAVVLCALVLSGCSYQKGITPAGEAVRVAASSGVTNCHHLGNTKIVLSGATRLVLNKPEALADEIAKEARNFAGSIGADAVVPSERFGSGTQVFQLYVCGRK